MEYISAEEFLKQPRKIQEMFLEYSPIKEGDLYKDVSDLDIIESLDYIKDDDESFIYHSMRENMSDYFTVVPLLTEGQLRKFIEDKTRYKVEINYYEINGYDLSLTEGKTNYFNYLDLGHDLLQAYWKVACEIAKEELSND